MSPSRRHVRKSSEVRRPLPTNGNPFSEKKFLSREVRYGYKGTIIRTRQYASGPACQNLGNVFLASVLGHTTDLDIENCCFTLLLQLLDFMKPELPQWAEVRATLVQCSQERDRVIREELGCQKSEGKGILMKVMNGGQPPAQLQKNQFIKKLQQASIFCRWVACSALPEIYQEMQEDADREQPEASTLFFMWTVVEEEYIHQKTKFSVKIRPKQHGDFLQLLAQRSDPAPADCPADFLCDGNCILASLHHLGFAAQAQIMLGNVEPEANTYFRQRQLRTYGQVGSECKLHLTPSLDWSSIELDDLILLHLVHRGRPHCIALSPAEANTVRLVDGTSAWTVPRADVPGLLVSAADSKYIILFVVRRSMRQPDEDDVDDKDLRDLLETQAAAKPKVFEELNDDFGWDAEEQSANEGDEDSAEALSSKGIDSADEGVTHVGDDLLDNMKKEVRRFNTERPPICTNSAGFRVCPFCPFRAWPEKHASRVFHHVKTYHTEPKQYVPSGTKQMKIIIALHDSNQCAGRHDDSYLRRSAAVLRRTVQPDLNRRSNHIDKEIRLVLTERGPEYWNAATVRSTSLRRVRNLYYTRGMAQLIYEEMVNNSAKVYAAHAAILRRIAPECASLLPRHSKHWWPIVEDIFISPPIQRMTEDIMHELIAHEELETISMDATMRCCLPVLGQAHPRATAQQKDAAVFRGESARTRASRCLNQSGSSNRMLFCWFVIILYICR
ncbi:unnamed protein product [Symbiodinium sp. KB8]|nr:unnamed protein product [Symbiodinium sp. KB8]